MPAAWVAGAAAVVGVAMSYESGQKQKAASDTNAANDMVVAQEQQERANINIAEQTRTNAYQSGQQEAAYAGSGVVMSAGSPLDELASKAISDKFETQVEAFNGLIDANASTADAGYQQALGSAEALSGDANAFSTGANAYLTFKYGKG